MPKVSEAAIEAANPMLAIAGFCLAVVDLGCWAVCFVWMHRISSRQNALLDELRQQGNRIERVSNEEH